MRVVTGEAASARRAVEGPVVESSSILALVAAGAPLREVLDALVRAVELQTDGMVGSILFVEDGRVRHASAPHLPQGYLDAIDGARIGPRAGSCGTAAYRREPVIVEDIATDPLWEPYRPIALRHALRACWSVPIFSQGEVVGTFALYYREPRRPTPELLDLTRHASHLAAIAIERSRREAALVESEAFARLVIDSALDANVIIDEVGVVVGWSRRAEEIFGWSRAEAVGRPLTELLVPERHRAAHQRGMERYRRTGVGTMLHRRVELEARHRDGHELPVAVSISPLRRNGRLLFSAFLADLTSTRRAEEALRASEAHLSLVYQHVEDGLFHLEVLPGEVYRFVSVNPAFTRTTGLGAEQVVGRRIDEVIPEPELTVARRRYAEAIATRRTVRWESVATRRGGGEWIGDVAITPVFDEEGVVRSLVGSARDITEQRRLEGELRQLQKMEAVGSLTGGVAHDFNNLLTVILGHAELALQSLPRDAPQRADVEAIAEAGDRAAALTRQLLAFARKQSLQPVRLDLGEVVRGVEKMLRRLVRENIRFELALAPDLWPVMADPGQIEQVLMNLAVNARDAIGDGGTIRFETSNVTLAEDTSEVPAGDYARLAVVDDGRGMDPETARRAFEPFFTTKPKGRGTGLGLSTVYGIVKQSGGRITLRSAPGRGTTVEVLLPRTEAPPQDVVEPETTVEPLVGRSVVLVEDDPALRALGEEMLRTLGCAVASAGSAEEGLRLVAGGLRPEVLVTDLMLPGMSGRDLAERLRAERPDLPVVLVSGYADPPVERGPAGMVFLPKPFHRRGLAEALRRALSGG